MAVILDAKNLSELVNASRKKAGLSQIELAELAGVGKTLIFNIEDGQINVHFEKLLKVLKVLNIKISIEAP